jgi:hypothetical protein
MWFGTEARGGKNKEWCKRSLVSSGGGLGFMSMICFVWQVVDFKRGF